MKTNRANTLHFPVTNMDMMDSDKVKAPLSVKVCDRFGTMCKFCKISASHPSPKNQTTQMKIGLGNKQKYRNQ